MSLATNITIAVKCIHCVVLCRKKGRFQELVKNSEFDWKSESHRDLLRFTLAVVDTAEVCICDKSMPYLHNVSSIRGWRCIVTGVL